MRQLAEIEAERAYIRTTWLLWFLFPAIAMFRTKYDTPIFKGFRILIVSLLIGGQHLLNMALSDVIREQNQTIEELKIELQRR